MGSKTLIFIHGWASAPEIWQGQREYFSKDHEVITPDIGAAKDITEAAGLIKEAIGGREDFILIGWSLGWLVVLELLKTYFSEARPRAEAEPRLQPKGLIAVNSTSKFCDAGYAGKGPTETHLSKMIRDCKRNPQETFEDFYKGMLTDTGKTMLSNVNLENVDYEKLIYGLYILRDCDYRNFLKNITVPTLIISGAKDAICAPEASEYMHKKIKVSELKVFDCGHMPFLDVPKEFNSAVDDFIRKL